MNIEGATRRTPAISRDSLSAKIYRDLRAQLMGGAFDPGERLNIRKLAFAYETSHTPVREAVMQLVSEGGLELRPGQDLRVPTLNIEGYAKIRQVRAPLEKLATEMAVPLISASQFNALKRINAAFFEAEERQKWKDALKLNTEFHFKIYGCCGNDILIRTIENLWLLTGPFLINQYPSPIHPHDAEHPHMQLLRAIREKDPETAGDVIFRGLDHRSSLVIEKLKRLL